jgi:hypothetical protein
MKSEDAVQIEAATTAKEFLDSLTENQRERLLSIINQPIEHNLVSLTRAWGLLESRPDEVGVQIPSLVSKVRF